MARKKYESFDAFYEFYLGEHKKAATKIIHCLGTAIGITGFVSALFRGNVWIFVSAVVFAYLIIWVSHFFIEKNRPATFKYPLWSFLADLRMFCEVITGKQKLSG